MRCRLGSLVVNVCGRSRGEPVRERQAAKSAREEPGGSQGRGGEFELHRTKRKSSFLS